MAMAQDVKVKVKLSALDEHYEGRAMLSKEYPDSS